MSTATLINPRAWIAPYESNGELQISIGRRLYLLALQRILRIRLRINRMRAYNRDRSAYLASEYFAVRCELGTDSMERMRERLAGVGYGV